MFDKLRRGDIYSADLSPSVGSEQSGFRPVLVLQNNIGNCFSPTIIIAAIVELEEKIEDAMMRRDAIAQQAITLEGIYKIMVNFDCVYNIISDEEKRAVVTALIKEIELYRNDESECPLKRIGLNFPVFKDGKEVSELLWDKGNTVETVLRMERRNR